MKTKTENQALLKKGSLLNTLAKYKYMYILMTPMVLVYFIFNYIPMYGMLIAFKDYSPFLGITGSPWAGLKYFITFFQGPMFARTLTNTVTISVYTIIFGFPIPIILALLLNELWSKRVKAVVSSILYLPHFVSMVVVCGMVVNFLSPSTGIINNFFALFGMEPQYFMAKPQYFRIIYVTMMSWKEAGFSSIIYVAALSGINTELYEAAKIDGANKFKQILHVTIPGILPTIAIMLILKIGNILNVGYEAIILLYQPSTYPVADVISTYVYRSGLIDANYSLATAVGFFNGVIGFILVYFSNRISRKISEVSLW